MTNKIIKIGISKNELAHNQKVADEVFEDLLNMQVETLDLGEILNQEQWSPRDGAAECVKYSKSHPNSLRKATHPLSASTIEEVQKLKQIADTIVAFNLVKDTATLYGIAEGSAARSRIDTKKISQRARESREGNENYERKYRVNAIYLYLEKLKTEYIQGKTNAELAREFLSLLKDELPEEKRKKYKLLVVGERTFANYVKKYKIEKKIKPLTSKN
ncbi:hypothetical protein [Shewanella frigidimarina]|uniref:hypothetical protein n=1 Tax=Shewanella frigidimarina TaxID=56812 RepID=UPI001404E612|nr:hypothetical protein [Shewanella frigidimarina]